MSPFIGIDLGTTNSAVATLVKGIPRVIPVDGERLLPSVVGLTPQGALLVGREAKNQLLTHPETTVLSVKRKMGSEERIQLGSRQFAPQEISSFILRKLKLAAEDYLGQPVQRAVITVPASFGDAQRRATKEAGELAGLDVLRIVNEPTAAALSFGVHEDSHERLAVYDLGGGTFDISVMEMQQGVLEVLSSLGDHHLGGDDFDSIMARHLAEELERSENCQIRGVRKTMTRLIQASEQAKIRLSSEVYTRLREEFLTTASNSPVHLDKEISRDQLEDWIGTKLLQTQEHLIRSLREARLKPEQISRVLLVGGSSRIPMVSKLIEEAMGKPPCREVNPDEAVALGAAIQAGIIEGEPIQAVLVDVAPHSLGIEVVHSELGVMIPDVMSFLIHRNTPIPCSMMDEFSTMTDNQRWVQINVCQGEHPVASENELMATFQLKGVKPGKAGEPRILVRFDYDANGIVHIQAMDKDTGSEERCVVQISAPKLTPRQKEKVMAEMPQITAKSRPMQSAQSILEKAWRVIEDKDRASVQKLREAADALEKALEDGDEEFAKQLEDQVVDLLYEMEG